MSYQKFQILVSLATEQGIKTIGEFKSFAKNYNANQIKNN
jgi:hypothetical protein